ncbi:tetratricopeptide repeat protein [Kitasatospora mediocidica]|uniref:helix-turn-helix transcriptional regulator n=1 Tax=Kitasatospora mediocidica TaxID=58352 RepID=UPI00055BB70F|nr:helix-turn-helix transcriptional regulator [Kitasatospora mediocidica]
MADPTPNLPLRALMTEHGLKASELAAAVNSAEQKLFGAPGNATDRQVRRWLSGEARTPHLHYIAALMSVFKVPADRLGFALTGTRVHQLARLDDPSTLLTGHPIDRQENAPVLRREFMIAATGNLLSFAFAPLPAAGRIGMSDVARIRESIDQLHAVDDAYGGEQLAEVAENYAGQIANAMGRCLYGPNVEKALYQVQGELSASAGWFAFDSGDHTRAARNFDAGLRGALLAGDRLLQARIWAYMARQSWELGRATETVTIARAALDATRGGRDPRLGALLHGRLALGYGAAGESARCGASLARADALLDQASDSAPAWLRFVGPGELLGAAAMAHMGLGQPEEAVRQEEEGMRLLGSAFQRNRFAKLVHLSECHLAAQEPEKAVATAGQALDLYGSVNCPRWAAKLHTFRDDVAKRALPETNEFVERYDVTTTTA